jgi:ParB family chromosome partitioning protein
MMNELPVDSIEDFPVISKLYKQNFSESNSHLLIGARIVPKSYIEELAESIRQEGLHYPVIVRRQCNGYQLLSGHLRKYAFKKLKKDVIPAKVIEVDDSKAKAMLITSNRFQHSLEAIEEAWVVKELIDVNNQSLRECANLLRMGKSWVSNRYMLATHLIREIQIDIVMGLIPARIATEIGSVHARGQLKVCSTIKRHKLSFRESHELIKIIKDKNTSNWIKKLALNDPRTVISKLADGDNEIYHSAKEKLSYFASNFQDEVHNLTMVSLEVLHRLNRDFVRFTAREQKILFDDLKRAYRKIIQLKKKMEELNYGKEFNQ